MIHIAAFSDLHLGAHYSPGRDWVHREITRIKPQVVVFAGDLFDRHTADLKPKKKALSYFAGLAEK